MPSKLFTIWLCIIAFIASIAGCHSPPPSAEARKQVQTLIDQGAVKHQEQANANDQAVTKAQGKNAVNAENGKNAPATHPLAAANETTKELHPLFLWLFTLGYIASTISIGLHFVPRTSAIGPLAAVISTIGLPLGLSSAIVSGFMLVSVPWIFFATIGLLAAWVSFTIYLMIKNKGNLSATIKEEERDFGYCASGGSTTAR